MVSHTKNILLRNQETIRDFLFLVIVAIIIYLPFLGQPAWDGNEPKRAIVAREMLKTGNYFAPVIHGQPYFVKPPLMNWLIAAGGFFGGVNEWTARLSSVLMTFATGLMLYFLAGYCAEVRILLRSLPNAFPRYRTSLYQQHYALFLCAYAYR